jgi:hypothetical protein
VLVVIAACGGDDGGGGGGGGDASNLPAMINVSGTTSDVGIGGRTPVANVMISAFKEGASTATATATSDASGNFTISIPTMGAPIDGYLLAHDTTHKDTFLYPQAPLTADQSAIPVLMLTSGAFNLASTLAQGNQSPGMGFIGVEAIDAANMPVAGVTFSSTPSGTVRYNKNGLPNSTATVTEADGIGYVFNVAAGTVTVSASKTGSTFHSHPVNARADQVTLTLVQ